MQAFSENETPFSPDDSAGGVRQFYEVHQYPYYPLFATPRWQEGYLTSSLFSAALVGKMRTSMGRKVLIAGAGEILPYVIRKWEPASHTVMALDASGPSLKRAKIRCLRTTKSVRFVTDDLNRFLAANGTQLFDHIDAFGVLHHLPDPAATLRTLARHLTPGGTMRLMVYNSASRQWIKHIQAMFRSFAVNYGVPDDLQWAQSFLRDLAAMTPKLAAKMAQMGPSVLTNAARFADTFLHPREARLPLAKWHMAAKLSSLTFTGLFDRYAELDHLANPLWSPPDPATLEGLAGSGAYQGNWEMFFQKGEEPQSLGSLGGSAGKPPLNLLTHGSPHLWWSFPETANVGAIQRGQLWAHFTWNLHRASNRVSKQSLLNWITKHPKDTVQRLARIGAILPAMVDDPRTRSLLFAPLASRMTQQDEEMAASVDRLEIKQAFLENQKRLIEKSVRLRKISAGRREIIGARVQALNELGA